MGKVIAVCTSERKGIQKTSVPEIKVIEDWGIEGDAHAGKWHRQVSLLSFDKIGKECHSGCAIFKKMGECIMPKQGVFTKVIHGGVIHPGDELVIL